MIVLDASAVLELLLVTRRGAEVARRIAPPQETLHAPHLLDLEVAQVLRRYEAKKVIDARRAAAAFEDLAALPLIRYPHDVLLPRIWELRRNATAYDAAYLALSEALAAPLLTMDAGMASARWHRARVDVIA